MDDRTPVPQWDCSLERCTATVGSTPSPRVFPNHPATGSAPMTTYKDVTLTPPPGGGTLAFEGTDANERLLFSDPHHVGSITSTPSSTSAAATT